MTPEAKHVGLSSLRLGFKSRPGRLFLGFSIKSPQPSFRFKLATKYQAINKSNGEIRMGMG